MMQANTHADRKAKRRNARSEEPVGVDRKLPSPAASTAALLLCIVGATGCESPRDAPSSDRASAATERSAATRTDDPPSSAAFCTRWVGFIDGDIQRMMNVPKDFMEANSAKSVAECKTMAEAGRAKDEAVYVDCASCVMASEDVNEMQARCDGVCDRLLQAAGGRPVPKTPTALPKRRARPHSP